MHDKKLLARLRECEFLRISTETDLLLFEVASGLLWAPGYQNTTFSSRQQVTETLKLEQLAFNCGTWRLPSRDELVDFAQHPNCPYRKGKIYRLFQAPFWLIQGGLVDLDVGYSDDIKKWESCPDIGPSLFPVNDAFQSDFDTLINHAIESDWTMQDAAEANGPNLLSLAKAGNPHASTKSSFNRKTPKAPSVAAFFDLKAQLQGADASRAKLPLLDEAQFTDPDKGVWEFLGMDPQELQTQGVRARDPARDVRDCNVAIDFGTSSTVVAYDDNGVHKLIRIGVTDFLEAAKPSHYENPTLLEFVDINGLLGPWRTEAYRPAVLWDDVRCSHEALHHFRNNQTEPKVVASVLTKIKQWALREGDGTRVRVTDQSDQRVEHELAALTLRQPVRGRLLEVRADDLFDPIELYAWFLGLTINWRGRGLFLRYYMTFPIAYPREVKEKILASFRRGLQRSLPLTLVTQPVLEQFTVEERASEPAAYAATALQCLGIEPTPEGVAYAVFDFGGGTTDFDFGYYRQPTDTEADDEGWETVFDHFGSGGDAFLGGENLLEHLAYRTFQHNIEVCRKHKITFTQPLDASNFPGSELFLERTQTATTNALMLIARLRSFWETGIITNQTGIEKIELLGRDGKKVPCELLISFEDLQTFLQARIELGIHNFLAALKKAFTDQPPTQVHVLLAGNASRSRIVLAYFGVLDDDDDNDSLHGLHAKTEAFVRDLFGEHPPVLTPHPPLPPDDNNLYCPTGKTGVALGLLRLCPGSPTLVLNHTAKNVLGDAPFLHNVGRIRMGKFHVCLPQGVPYQAWVELGPVRERVFTLVHSQESRAHLGDMKEGEIGLYQKRQDFAGNTQGLRVYARAVSPHDIELCAAASAEAAENGLAENVRRITLG